MNSQLYALRSPRNNAVLGIRLSNDAFVRRNCAVFSMISPNLVSTRFAYKSWIKSFVTGMEKRWEGVRRPEFMVLRVEKGNYPYSSCMLVYPILSEGFIVDLYGEEFPEPVGVVLQAPKRFW